MNYYRDAVVRIIKDNLHERRSNLMTNTFLSNTKLVVKQFAGYLAIAPNALKSQQSKLKDIHGVTHSYLHYADFGRSHSIQNELLHLKPRIQ